MAIIGLTIDESELKQQILVVSNGSIRTYEAAIVELPEVIHGLQDIYNFNEVQITTKPSDYCNGIIEQIKNTLSVQYTKSPQITFKYV